MKHVLTVLETKILIPKKKKKEIYLQAIYKVSSNYIGL